MATLYRENIKFYSSNNIGEKLCNSKLKETEIIQNCVENVYISKHIITFTIKFLNIFQTQSKTTWTWINWNLKWSKET